MSQVNVPDSESFYLETGLNDTGTYPFRSFKKAFDPPSLQLFVGNSPYTGMCGRERFDKRNASGNSLA